MKHLLQDDPEIAKLIEKEEQRIESTLNLIAAENHAPPSIMEVMGSVFNAKTIEGYPGNRFHAGCQYVDEVEELARQRACQLFGAEHANVQPHSGTSANLAVYFSVLQAGDKVLAMSLPHGGHLSHGHKASMTSQCFNFKHYTLDPITEHIDYNQVRDMAHAFKPKMIVAGASSYPRLIDYAIMAEIAAEVSAFLLADIAHLAGLIAGKVIPSPVPHCDFVTFTGYKTMMGGRGGIILCREKYAKKIDHAIFPGGQGTSAVNLIAAKALIFHLAMKPDFAKIQQKTLEYASLMAQCLADKGYRLVTGGTENHQVLVDLGEKGISGAVAEKDLEYAGIVLNRNVVPRDADTPGSISGLRIGTGALAARRMQVPEIIRIADLIDTALRSHEDQSTLEIIRGEVEEMCRRFPVYLQWH